MCLLCACVWSQMPTAGPCANPKCTDKWKASGQFTLLDEEFVAEHSNEIDQELEYPAHCGKRPCRRWCGKLGPIGGSAQGGGSQVVAGVGCPGTHYHSVERMVAHRTVTLHTISVSQSVWLRSNLSWDAFLFSVSQSVRLRSNLSWDAFVISCDLSWDDLQTLSRSELGRFCVGPSLSH